MAKDSVEIISEKRIELVQMEIEVDAELHDKLIKAGMELIADDPAALIEYALKRFFVDMVEHPEQLEKVIADFKKMEAEKDG